MGICQFENRYSTVAQLFADAFAADPHLAEVLVSQCEQRAAQTVTQTFRQDELSMECRYPAIRCAALAGSGLTAIESAAAATVAISRSQYRPVRIMPIIIQAFALIPAT